MGQTESAFCTPFLHIFYSFFFNRQDAFGALHFWRNGLNASSRKNSNPSIIFFFSYRPIRPIAPRSFCYSDDDVKFPLKTTFMQEKTPGAV